MVSPETTIKVGSIPCRNTITWWRIRSRPNVNLRRRNATQSRIPTAVYQLFHFGRILTDTVFLSSYFASPSYVYANLSVPSQIINSLAMSPQRWWKDTESILNNWCSVTLAGIKIRPTTDGIQSHLPRISQVILSEQIILVDSSIWLLIVIKIIIKTSRFNHPLGFLLVCSSVMNGSVEVCSHLHMRANEFVYELANKEHYKSHTTSFDFVFCFCFDSISGEWKSNSRQFTIFLLSRSLKPTRNSTPLFWAKTIIWALLSISSKKLSINDYVIIETYLYTYIVWCSAREWVCLKLLWFTTWFRLEKYRWFKGNRRVWVATNNGDYRAHFC